MNQELIADERSRAFRPESEQDGPAREDDRKAAGMKMQQEQHPESHLFTLRIWQEVLGEGKAEWRGRVQEIVTGETLFFRDWQGLTATLLRLMEKTAASGESSRAQPKETEKDHESDPESVSCHDTSGVV